MEYLMSLGWRFEFFQNKLGSYTAIAKKNGKEIITDDFELWPLQVAIVAKVEEYEAHTRNKESQ